MWLMCGGTQENKRRQPFLMLKGEPEDKVARFGDKRDDR